MSILQDIHHLKQSKQALILVHNYQRPEIQEIADFLGDSLELSRRAAQSDARIIVFCGVRFMAETAKILSPDKKVLLPVREAGCPMAEMISPEELKKLKARYPGAAVVSYVNTNADIKALSDACCTSSNAVRVINHVPARQIIFTPDGNLASWCQRFVDKEIIPWNGYCYVHQRISEKEVQQAKQRMPDALLLVHPECRPGVIDLADEVLSTNQMVEFVRQSGKKRFLIATEEGLISRLKRENPGKEFYAAGTIKICRNMKLTTLEDVYLALKHEQYPVHLSEDTIRSCQKALQVMIACD
jgi:quinolinate synthase